MLSKQNLEQTLYEAAAANNKELVERCINEGATGQKLINGESALHKAVEQRNILLINLLAARANPLLKNSAAQTAIAMAAYRGFWEGVIACAAIKATTLEIAREYSEALLVAANKQQPSVVLALLRVGGEPRTNHHNSADDVYYYGYSQTFNSKLWLAIDNMVGLLVQRDGGSKAISKTIDENSIVIAARNKLWDWVIAISSINCNDVYYANDYYKNQAFKKALLEAARHNQYDVVAVLLKNSTSANSSSDYGNTPLHWAAYHRNSAMVALLSSYGADDYRENKARVSPTQLAERIKYLDFFEAYRERNEYLVKYIRNIQMILFYLLAAHERRDREANPFSLVPPDILKHILKLAFKDLGPGASSLYGYEAAYFKYVTQRPERQFIASVLAFVKDHSKAYGFFSRICGTQPQASFTLIDSLEKIVDTHIPVNTRVNRLHSEISQFTNKPENKDTAAMDLLINHGLFKPIVRQKPADKLNSTLVDGFVML